MSNQSDGRFFERQRSGRKRLLQSWQLGLSSDMDWQQVASLGVVAATAAVFAWGKLHRRKSHFARDTHCGCSSAGQPAPGNSIVFHARKGGRPRVLVKWR